MKFFLKKHKLLIFSILKFINIQNVNKFFKEEIFSTIKNLQQTQRLKTVSTALWHQPHQTPLLRLPRELGF